MTKLITIVALLTMAPALAQTGVPSTKPPLTDREQVKADRAKAAEDDKAATTARPWDRDAYGRRPWERSR
ncbi:hypothetical protein XH80_04395 [Bradyrhizobium sp. CCBAU 45384]|nr:hypothetical protein [Bradyrhizobium sp. CCBAU 45384]